MSNNECDYRFASLPLILNVNMIKVTELRALYFVIIIVRRINGENIIKFRVATIPHFLNVTVGHTYVLTMLM